MGTNHEEGMMDLMKDLEGHEPTCGWCDGVMLPVVGTGMEVCVHCDSPCRVPGCRFCADMADRRAA